MEKNLKKLSFLEGIFLKNKKKLSFLEGIFLKNTKTKKKKY